MHAMYCLALIQTLTVGFGISPNQPLARVADYTAGGELRPAPKNLYSITKTIQSKPQNAWLQTATNYKIYYIPVAIIIQVFCERF